jgi:hypothetical protein
VGDVLGPILRRTVVAGALGTAIMLAGCGLSAGPNEYVVDFVPGTPTDQAKLVGQACPGVGKATLEPADRNKQAISRAYPVRYDITNASSSDKAALAKCLKTFTIVRGVHETNDDA